MGLADIYKARHQPPQPKASKPRKLIPAHVIEAVASGAPARTAPHPPKLAKAARPAAPTEAKRNDTYQEYWDRRRQEDEERGRATMAAIAEAAAHQPEPQQSQRP